MTQDETVSQQRQFGPMPPVGPAAASNISEDRIVARILAALGGQVKDAEVALPQAPTLSAEDERLVAALASVHPSGKQVGIIVRDELTARLFFVVYAYTPASSSSRVTACALVYDNGQRSHVFGGFYNG